MTKGGKVRDGVAKEMVLLGNLIVELQKPGSTDLWSNKAS